MDRAVDAANLAANAADLSIWGLFVQADIVVKLVMILLVFASVWVWAIVFEKITSLRRANRAADAFEDRGVAVAPELHALGRLRLERGGHDEQDGGASGGSHRGPARLDRERDVGDALLRDCKAVLRLADGRGHR